METTLGKVIYIVLFLLFCGLMRWRMRVRTEQLNDALSSMKQTSNTIQNTLKR